MISIRSASDADRPQILARIAEVFGREHAARLDRLWEWRWRLDPRLPTPGYRGVVAERQGEIVGTLTTLPAGLFIGGGPVEAHWCVDCLVHPDLRRRLLAERVRQGQSPASDSQRDIAAALLDHPAAGPIQLVKHISPPGLRLLERAGFSGVPDSGSLHRRVSLRHTLTSALGRPLGSPLGAVVDLALPVGPRPRLPIEVLSGGFDARFDRLWDEVRERYTAIGRRDARTLEWRYRQHPDSDYRVVVTRDGSRLRGYLVLLAYRKGRRRWAKIVDLLTAPGDTEAIRALTSGALRLLRDWRAERVESFACGEGIAAELAGLGFVPRLARSGRAVPLMARALPTAAAGLYATQGDGDGG